MPKEDKLINVFKNKYDTCNTKDSCLIDFNLDLNSLIKNQWDSVIVFQSVVPELVKNISGIDSELLAEGGLQKIMFIKNKKVVYQVGFDPDYGQDVKGVIFNDKLPLVLPRNKSKFFISKFDAKESGNNKYIDTYWLKWINR